MEYVSVQCDKACLIFEGAWRS